MGPGAARARPRDLRPLRHASPQGRPGAVAGRGASRHDPARRARQPGVRGVADRDSPPRALVHDRHRSRAAPRAPGEPPVPDPRCRQPRGVPHLARPRCHRRRGHAGRRAPPRRRPAAAAPGPLPALRPLRRMARQPWARPVVERDPRARPTRAVTALPRSRNRHPLHHPPAAVPGAAVSYEPRQFWEQRLREHFDLRGTGEAGLSLAYNRAGYALRREVLERALREAHVALAGASVLDVGCGTGFFTNFSLERGARVTGIDIAAASVERLAAEFPEARFVRADVGEEEIAERYDLVNMFDVSFHITDDWRWEFAVRNGAGGGWGGVVVISTAA